MDRAAPVTPIAPGALSAPEPQARSSAREQVECPLCERDHTERHFTSHDVMYDDREPFTWVCCRSCGLYFLNPRPPAEVIGEFYPSDYYSYVADTGSVPGATWGGASAAGEAARARLRSSLLGRLLWNPLRALRDRVTDAVGSVPHVIREGKPLGPPGRILDVGCGAGQFLDAMRDAGWETWGVEISARAAEAAAGSGHQVFVGDLTSLELPRESFSVVRLWHTLEHVHDPVRVLQACRACLRPDGVLILGVPNVASWPPHLYGPAWMGWDIPRHFWAFSPATLRQLVTRAGFQPERHWIFTTPLLLAISANWKQGGTLEQLDRISPGGRLYFRWLAALLTWFRQGDVVCLHSRVRP